MFTLSFINNGPKYLTFKSAYPNMTISSITEGNPSVDGLEYNYNETGWTKYNVR